MAVILIAIGMLLTGIDIHGRFGILYPAFHVGGAVGKYELSESIQLYTTKNILGNEVQVDFLPDVLGCLFILAGVCMLVKYNRQFLLSIPFIVATAVLSVLLRVSGFITQGPDLVVWILACYFLQIACELFMEYFVIYCTAGATDEYEAAVRLVDHRALPGVHVIFDVCRAFWREAVVSGRAWPGDTLFPLPSGYDAEIRGS